MESSLNPIRYKLYGYKLNGWLFEIYMIDWIKHTNKINELSPINWNNKNEIKQFEKSEGSTNKRSFYQRGL